MKISFSRAREKNLNHFSSRISRDRDSCQCLVFGVLLCVHAFCLAYLCLYSLNKLCLKQSLLRSLWKKVHRLEKSTPPWLWRL